MMQRVGSTDLAIVSYSTLVPQSQTTTIPLTKLYNPRCYMPTHHDGNPRAIHAPEPRGDRLGGRARIGRPESGKATVNTLTSSHPEWRMAL